MHNKKIIPATLISSLMLSNMTYLSLANNLEDNEQIETKDNIKNDIEETKEVIVEIPDIHLKNAIYNQLLKDESEELTSTEMESLDSLELIGTGISDLTGLRYAKNLKSLSFDNCSVEDISELSNLKQLETLSFEGNKVTDLSPLGNLSNLKKVSGNNQKIDFNTESNDGVVKIPKGLVKGFDGDYLKAVAFSHLEYLDSHETEDKELTWKLPKGNHSLEFKFFDLRYEAEDATGNISKEFTYYAIFNVNANVTSDIFGDKEEDDDAIDKSPTLTAQDVVLNVGDVFEAKKYVSATNYKGEDISQYVLVIYDDVDTSKPGTYNVTYRILSEGVTLNKTIAVTVKENVSNLAPILKHPDNITVYKGDVFNPRQGVTAIDYSGLDISQYIIVNHNVDINKTGDYTVTYTVLGSNGRIASSTIPVIVKEKPIEEDKKPNEDTKPNIEDEKKSPTIVATDITLNIGDTFDPKKGISAKDFDEKDLTNYIVIVHNTVDTSKADTYYVTYRVLGSNGVAETKTIKVVVTGKEPLPKPQTGDFTSIYAGTILLSSIGLISTNRKKEN